MGGEAPGCQAERGYPCWASPRRCTNAVSRAVRSGQKAAIAASNERGDDSRLCSAAPDRGSRASRGHPPKIRRIAVAASAARGQRLRGRQVVQTWQLWVCAPRRQLEELPMTVPLKRCRTAKKRPCLYVYYHALFHVLYLK